MLTVRARVRNGRLIVDEPTDLPDGMELELRSDDDLTEEQCTELKARIADKSEHILATDVIARLRGA